MVAATFPACSGEVQGIDDRGNAPEIPPTCMDELTLRGSGAPACDASVAKCNYVERDTTNEYVFSIAFVPMVDPKAAQCLADFLESRGAQAKVEMWGGLSITGTFEALEPALKYTIVTSYHVGGCPGGCTRCSNLTIDTCDNDAFCATIKGSKYDPTNMCWEASMSIGCGEAPNGCPLAPSAVLDPQGACWVVDCSGAPIGWTGLRGQTCPGSTLDDRACP